MSLSKRSFETHTERQDRIQDLAPEMFAILKLANQLRFGDEFKPLSDRIAAVVAKVERP